MEHDANYGATFKYNDGTIEHLYLSKENGNGQSIEVTPVKGVIYNGGVKEQDLVTLTMKYNDGATADSTYNVASGTTTSTFSPDATCTRAQSVTFLFRAIGKLVDSKAEFSDVLTDSYYANAVAWAVENGVTNGIGNGLFGPDNSCTRAQIVTFLFRAYQGK